MHRMEAPHLQRPNPRHRKASPHMKPSVFVVLLSWNQCQLTLECLASLSRQTYEGGRLHTVVVDNASSDDTVAQVRAMYPSVTVLRNDANLGYAAGNNVGIRYSLDQGADFCCVLNNDVTVRPDLVSELVRGASQSSDIAAATPLLAFASHPERVWALGGSMTSRTGDCSPVCAGQDPPALMSQPDRDVDVAQGAAMLIRRQALLDVGLLDESYYLYREEVDWCLRARRQGYRILAVPSAQGWHKISASLEGSSPAIDYYMLRNHYLLLARNWGGLARISAMARVTWRAIKTISAYTLQPQGEQRRRSRNARLYALRDALWRRWGEMGDEVKRACGLVVS